VARRQRKKSVHESHGRGHERVVERDDSSHVLSLIPGERTQWVYSGGLVVVSARTNKRHHHQQKTHDTAGNSLADISELASLNLKTNMLEALEVFQRTVIQFFQMTAQPDINVKTKKAASKLGEV
jgi:hypothetical protein